MSCASCVWSPVSCATNSRVPDLAMVPMLSITSWRDMPTPLSVTAIVRAVGSTSTSTARSGCSSSSAASVSASKRSLSQASDAFEMSSRRNISLFE